MTIVEKQQRLVHDFSTFKDWEGRYRHLIRLGKGLPVLAEKHRIEQNRVRGCQSQAWLYGFLDQKKVVYEADSDALIVRGLIALLVFVFSGHEPKEILNAGTDFLNEIGLTTHLSQSRSNGLSALVRQFKNYALAFDVMLRQKTGT